MVEISTTVAQQLQNQGTSANRTSETQRQNNESRANEDTTSTAPVDEVRISGEAQALLAVEQEAAVVRQALEENTSITLGLNEDFEV